MVEAGRQQLAQRRHGVDHAPLGHLEHHRLGPVHHGGHVFGNAVAELGDLAGHGHQPPQQSVLLHDAGVVGGVRRRGGVHLQRDQDRGISHGVEQARTPQLVGDGHGVGGFPAGVERHDRPVDVAVGGLVEVLGHRALQGGGDGVARQEHGPEERLLGIEVVRGDTSAGRLEPVDARFFERLGHGLPTLDYRPWG